MSDLYFKAKAILRAQWFSALAELQMATCTSHEASSWQIARILEFIQRPNEATLTLSPCSVEADRNNRRCDCDLETEPLSTCPRDGNPTRTEDEQDEQHPAW